jgi:hypothetical protein
MADKSKTIKNASDKELNELIIRLRKEYELQNLVGDLKRNSNSNSVLPYDRPEVSTEEPIESLYHYGILGMRWGRRKGFTAKRQIEYDKKKATDDLISDDYKKKGDLKRKKISQMSNKELKELNERLQLEKQYKDLSKAEISAGRKFAQDLLRDAGKEVAKEIIKESLKKGIKLAVKR